MSQAVIEDIDIFVEREVVRAEACDRRWREGLLMSFLMGCAALAFIVSRKEDFVH